MNRRELLTGAFSAATVVVAGKVVAKERPGGYISYMNEDRYWEQQRIIDELHEAAEYMPMTHDGTDFRAALKASDVMDFSSAAIK